MKKKQTEHCRIGIYMRLSKEAVCAEPDGKGKMAESNSITMQRILLRTYAAAHFTDYTITEYQDDGFSGTNFERPGVERLLEDARRQKLDCILVKDFSRFGRDYIELGAYLEQIFPFLGIRFISVNDHYDSENYRGKIADLDVNFKNLLYDLYSKDLSQKVKSSLSARKESGKYVSANAPFGYEKSRKDRHMLVICEEEAELVRQIFSLTLQGMSSPAIADKLNREQVPPPIVFKIRKGEVSRKPKGARFFWSASSICAILRNPVYAGDIVYGKTEREQVGGKNVLKARKDWKRIRNHHAPIVSREDFEAVQKTRRGGGRRRRKPGEDIGQMCHSKACQELRRVEKEYARLQREHCDNYRLYRIGRQKEFHSLRAELEEKEEEMRRLKEQMGGAIL